MQLRALYKKPEFWFAMVLLALILTANIISGNPGLLLVNYWPAGFIAMGCFQLFSTSYKDIPASTFLIALGCVLLSISSGWLNGDQLLQLLTAVKSFLVNLLIA